MNPYIGHGSQLYGIEEHRLIGGKGDGLRLLEVTNGRGLQLTVSPDRASDISRLRYKGINMSYMSPCGYVAPAYYDRSFLNSFTAGFLTTCGLEAVGTPCEDEGVSYPLHGTIAQQPCESIFWGEEDDALVLRSTAKDETMFGRKLRLSREISVSILENSFDIRDTIENTGDKKEAFEVLYHMNMGYPLLDEDSIVTIPSSVVIPRNEHAAEDIENCLKMEEPQAGYEERCYYHNFPDGNGRASIFQPKLDLGLEISYDASKLDGFVEWKMMGIRDYALGLECGNCYPDGRDAMRRNGMLKFLEAGETITYEIHIAMLDQMT